jgi:hypothetical protein
VAIGCQHAPHDPVPELAASTVPVASAPAASVAAPSPAPAPVAAPACGDPGDVLLFTTPAHPVKGQRMQVVAVTDKLVDAQLTVASLDGLTAAPTVKTRQGGPPYAWIARIAAPMPGAFLVSLVRDAACGPGNFATTQIDVGTRPSPVPGTPRTALWFTRAGWTPSLENLYSAWIEHLFNAPLEEQPSWNALHEVLRDPERNFLYDHLGAAEDEQNVIIRPDCADLPYFLRAYFAFKLGLPFGWSRCSRGENGVPPVCGDFATSSDPFPKDPNADAKPPVLPPWADPARSGIWESNVRRLGEFSRAPVGLRPTTIRATTTPSRCRPRACGRERSSRIRTGTCWWSRTACRRRRPREGCCWRSTVSPTARSPASASGAATSCSRSIRRSAARASSASGRSCETTSPASGVT